MTTLQQLQLAKESTEKLRIANTDKKNRFLERLADLLDNNIEDILLANEKDISLSANLTKAMLKRLTLTEQLINGMAQGLRELIVLPDPVGVVEEKNERPNGMTVAKMRVPIGVILFVYESRPNVIIDSAGLCIKSGNALIARGGKEAQNSNTILLKYIQQALKETDLPEFAVQQLEDRKYEAIAEVVKMDKYIDLVVPRGREKMIQYIRDNARVPVIAHDRGLCHMYIDSEANKDMVISLAINAKISNPSTCNSIEKILVHKDVVDEVMPDLLEKLFSSGVEVRGDERTCQYDTKCILANDEDWDTEYLDMIITIKIVDSYDSAVAHIAKHSSHLTDTIITENMDKADNFLRSVNSAVVLHNASNRLVDGGIFGLGAELGISTCSIHMRGPMGLKDLTVTKYIVMGNGQVR